MRYRFWAWVHDVCGAVECNAERLRLRAVKAMARSIDWRRR